MAKSKTRGHKSSGYSPRSHVFYNRLRDDISIASDHDRTFEPVSRSLHVPDRLDQVLDYLDNPVVRSNLTEFEDHRTFKPAAEQPALSTRSVAAKGRMSFGDVRQVMAFAHPKSVLVCLRRAMRREVIHALSKNGKGSGRPRRFTENSKVRC